MDVHDKETRSKNMAAIKNKNTKPERKVRRILAGLGFRYRIHYKLLPGTPDIVIPKYRAVIMVHGCFWHQHNCELFVQPKTNSDCWMKKIEANCQRDNINRAKLSELGWRVLVVWECALMGKNKLDDVELSSILEEWICSNGGSTEIDSRGYNLRELA
jgi:DNA mismatch endonuclease (patch repair protein)